MRSSFNIWFRTQVVYALLLLLVTLFYIGYEIIITAPSGEIPAIVIFVLMIVAIVEATFSLPAILLLTLCINIIKETNIPLKEKLILTGIAAAFSFYICALLMVAICLPYRQFFDTITELIFNCLTAGVIVSSIISISINKKQLLQLFNETYEPNN